MKIDKENPGSVVVAPTQDGRVLIQFEDHNGVCAHAILPPSKAREVAANLADASRDAARIAKARS